MKRISICDSLMTHNKIDPFLKRIVTGDEKLKSAFIQKKGQFSLLGNWPNCIPSGNARPHTSLMRRQKTLCKVEAALAYFLPK